jgi:hypothetical protein
MSVSVQSSSAPEQIDCMCSRASSAASSPPMRQGNHCSSSNRVPKIKLQASELSGPESLRSQTRPCPKKRLSISRLGVVHRRLNGCNGGDIAQHHQPVLNGDLSDWTILQLLQERFGKAGSKTGASSCRLRAGCYPSYAASFQLPAAGRSPW